MFVDAVGDVAFEVADGFFGGFASGELFLVVGVSFAVGLADLGEGCCVEGLVDAAVSSSVESVSDDPSAAGFEWCGAVGHREFGFGGISVGVSDLGDDLAGGEVSDAVDLGEGGAAGFDQCSDLGGEFGDLAGEGSYVAGSLFGDLGAGGGVTGQDADHSVVGGGVGEGGGKVGMVTAQVGEVGVETVDLPGATFDQFTAEVHQEPQVFCDTVGPWRGKVLLSGGDPGDQTERRWGSFLTGVRCLCRSLLVICGGTSTTSIPVFWMARAAGRP